jgi:hypothetical protein
MYSQTPILHLGVLQLFVAFRGQLRPVDIYWRALQAAYGRVACRGIGLAPDFGPRLIASNAVNHARQPAGVLSQRDCSAAAHPRWATAGLFFDTGSFSSLPRIRRYCQYPGEASRMMELLIGTASWLATLGFVAAIIVDTFR